MNNLNLKELENINGGGVFSFFKDYALGKALDYVIDNTLNPSEHSKEIARRAYGSKWKMGNRYN
ncbi:hypothetical protein [Clostridium perfringens]|uniref:Bacteriocin-type signal sequence domain protein n=2 Tax=Clostridium perfringens TaxID=1502 RepID=I7HHX5_CLOPF|nr:hypothetical protein [Clostridium perfringens]EDT22233.1 bacteriocin-type signal sequence domain protein [Clostridium perfringens B str. ATCC 3626]MCX0383635.1 hypothetical protein [Clostridium perfringens]NGU31772.1 hypothetical protein [Clostridium perfringens]BAM35174.1 bacteriocin-type signal sequence domain protein [Clostridium perfringens]